MGWNHLAIALYITIPVSLNVSKQFEFLGNSFILLNHTLNNLNLSRLLGFLNLTSIKTKYLKRLFLNYTLRDLKKISYKSCIYLVSDLKILFD